MSIRYFLFLALSLFLGAVFTVRCGYSEEDKFDQMLGLMASELDATYHEIKLFQDETKDLVVKSDLNSGFWAGNLWLMFELSGDEKWKERALQFTIPLEGEHWNGESAMLGAEMMSSFGRAIKYFDNKHYRDVLVHSAKVLSSRFNPAVGAIGELKTDSDGPYFSVNIENMLNIDLLFWAAKATGNENYNKIAVRHVQTSLKDHFRADKSCNEVVDYDIKTGNIRRKYNRHAPFNKTFWSLGQASALHGLTTAYRETSRDEFLIHAEEIAGLIISKPRNEFNRQAFYTHAVADESAPDYGFSIGVMIASALYELSAYSVHADDYVKTADEILANIVSVKFYDVSGERVIEGHMFSRASPRADSNWQVRQTAMLTGYYFLESLIHKSSCAR